MAFISTTPLNKLNSSKIKWVIRVRAQAIWKGITRETNEFRGIIMLFIDDSVTTTLLKFYVNHLILSNYVVT